jgi:hypothetical protein
MAIIAAVNTSATISTRAARLAMGMIISYQILLVVLMFLRPDLDPDLSQMAVEHGRGGHSFYLRVLQKH